MSPKEKKKLLITGASGMLGKAILKAIHNSFQVIPTDICSSQNILRLDITSSQSLRQVIKFKPDIIINLAAYTNVDVCETDRENAYKVNVLAVKNLASICKGLDIPILHMSTDYVFDGTKSIPYNEWDKPNPISVYGSTKAESEKYILALKKYWLVRSSGLYGKGGKNFVDTILAKARTSYEPLKVVVDQIGSPTYINDLANAIVKLIDTDYYGIYHVTNSDWCSWYEFAKAVLQFAKIKCEVIPISSAELARHAKRPKNFRLLNFIWENSIGKPLRPWQEALNEYIKGG